MSSEEAAGPDNAPFHLASCVAANIVNKVMNSMPDVGKQMEYLLATGNLKSRSGLNLQQVSYSNRSVVMVTISVVSGLVSNRDSRLWLTNSTFIVTCLTSDVCIVGPSSVK